jgi:hypothetical protein
MLQGVNSGSRKSSCESEISDVEHLKNQLQDEEKCPDIVCLHSGMVGDGGESLKDWFEHLFRQAQKRIEGCASGNDCKAAG